MGLSATLDVALADAPDAVVLGIITAARRGDAAAQAELFARHHPRVARHILRMTGDAASVDDLVQEVFVAAFGSLGSFRGESQFDTWLHTITSNKVRNWWDARRRREARERRAVFEADRDAAATGPDETLEQRQQLQAFYTALGELPDKLREAFTARAIEHMSLEDASALLGVPISTLSYRTRRAEELLCQALGLPPPPGRGDKEGGA